MSEATETGLKRAVIGASDADLAEALVLRGATRFRPLKNGRVRAIIYLTLGDPAQPKLRRQRRASLGDPHGLLAGDKPSDGCGSRTQART